MTANLSTPDPMPDVGLIHDIVWKLVPAIEIPLGPAQILITIGLAGLGVHEYRQWKKHR